MLLTLSKHEGSPVTPAGENHTRIIPTTSYLPTTAQTTSGQLQRTTTTAVLFPHTFQLKHHYCSCSLHGRFHITTLWYDSKPGVKWWHQLLKQKYVANPNEWCLIPRLSTGEQFQASSDHFLLRSLRQPTAQVTAKPPHRVKSSQCWVSWHATLYHEVSSDNTTTLWYLRFVSSSSG